jgi:DNA replication protein DnaC
MNIDHHIVQQLKILRLGGFLETLDLRLKEAQEEDCDHLSFLQLMLQDEIERREARRLTQRLSRASFEEEKTLEGFDFSFNPKIKRALINNLATCIFIERKEHVLIYGPAGVGKTHLAQAIGHEACRKGYDVLFVKAIKMLRSLHAARADHSWEKRIKKFLRPQLLIIDDFGLTALTPAQAEDFYEIVTERHLKSSMIINSNRPPQDWIPLFPDPVMANSALDRLAHHAHHIIIGGGESYRKKLRPTYST